MTGRFRNQNASALSVPAKDNANVYLTAVLLTLLCSCELAGDGIQRQIMLQEVLESPSLKLPGETNAVIHRCHFQQQRSLLRAPRRIYNKTSTLLM